MSKKTRREDANQAAARTVQQATSEEPAEAPKKNPHAVALGRRGGKKGGPARAKKLSAKRRSEIASKAVKARWKKASKKKES